MQEQDAFDAPDEEAGIFTWCLEEDTLYADTALAALFGLDPAATLKGLPVAEYMARVHPDDRGIVADRIRRALVDGQSYWAEFRVTDAQGAVRTVMSFGRCFRDRTGVPAHYAGIVHPLDS